MLGLFAVGDEVAAGGAIGVLLLVVGGLGAWVINLKKANQEIAVSKGEERRKDKTADAAEELSLLDQATRRITILEQRDEDKNRRLNDCESDRASLRKEIEWLNRYAGKSPALPDTPSGTHRPTPGTEGADV